MRLTYRNILQGTAESVRARVLAAGGPRVVAESGDWPVFVANTGSHKPAYAYDRWRDKDSGRFLGSRDRMVRLNFCKAPDGRWTAVLEARRLVLLSVISILFIVLPLMLAVMDREHLLVGLLCTALLAILPVFALVKIAIPAVREIIILRRVVQEVLCCRPGHAAFASPNGKHSISLTPLGEIRFGPPYFQVSVDGVVLRDRVFGDKVAWSEDSRYVALEEWLTTDYEKGPVTRLLVIDTARGTNAASDRIDKGFVQDIVFSGTTVSYVKVFFAEQSRIPGTIHLRDIKGWVDIGRQPAVTSGDGAQR